MVQLDEHCQVRQVVSTASFKTKFGRQLKMCLDLHLYIVVEVGSGLDIGCGRRTHANR